MTILTINRTKRPRDAWKLIDSAGRLANTITLTSLGIDPRNGGYDVVFKHVAGAQRTRPKKIPPFWDTDVATSLLTWAKSNGIDGGLAVGNRFLTNDYTDAFLIRTAFA